MDVHLRGLRFFLAVAEHLSFTRAAEVLFVSQPTLSKQVRSLEDNLRVELFVRDRRNVRLTAAGEALLTGAAAVLQAWEAAQADLTGVVATAGTTLVVGVHVGVERGLLRPVRARLSQASPPLHLRVRQASWSDPTAGLAAPFDSGSDAAFVWLPLPQPERFHWVPVAHEPRRLLVSNTHRLAGQTSVEFKDLLEEPFLALPRDAGPLRAHFLGVRERGGREVRVGAEIASTEEAVEALNADLGICLVAAGNVQTLLRDGIAALDVTGLSDLDLVLAWRRNDTRRNVRRFVQTVAAAVAEVQPSSSPDHSLVAAATPTRLRDGDGWI